MSVDVLAIGPHPDDVELGCGATLAGLAGRGRRVGILHLTRGEAGTRGTPEERQREAENAARALGAVTVEFLDCGDGRLRHTETEEEALIEVLRRLRPELVLGPAPADRHPDHGRSHRLVADACFYAGLARRGQGKPHRPAALFCYMMHDPFEPSFIVDAAPGWEAKLAALDAYESQIHGPAATAGGPVTKIATPEFRLAMEGRGRHFGNLIGSAFGEPFWNRVPPAVADPFDLLPQGVR